MRQQAGGRKQQAVCELGLGIPWAYPKAGGGRLRRQAGGQAAGGRQAACSRQQTVCGLGLIIRNLYPGIPKTRRRQAGRRRQAAGRRLQAAGRQEAAGGGRCTLQCGIASIYPPRWWLLGICFWVQRVWHRINRPSSLVATWYLFLGAEGVA